MGIGRGLEAEDRGEGVDKLWGGYCNTRRGGRGEKKIPGERGGRGDS